MASIYDAVTEVVTAYQQFKADPNKDRANDFTSRLARLLDSLNKVSIAAGNLKENDDRRRAAMAQIDTILAMDDSVALEKFFDEVGKSVVRGQQQLDIESRHYNDTRPAGLAETWFAIPNVKAEIKLGFSQVSGKGLNVVVFQNHDQKQKYGESTVSFEVVAAPSAPKMRETIPGRPAQEAAADATGKTAGLEAITEAALRPKAIVVPADEFEGGAASITAFPSGEESLDDVIGGTAAIDASLPTAATARPGAPGLRGPKPFTFPLAAADRQPILNSLSARTEGPHRDLLTSGEAEISVLPSLPGRSVSQGYLVLCSGSNAEGAGPALHSARVYYAEGSENDVQLRTGIYHYAKPVNDAKRVLAVAPKEIRLKWAKSAPANLQYLVRNLGDVLMTVTLYAAKFDPPFALDGAAAGKFRERMLAAFPRSRVLRKALEPDLLVFRDPRPSPGFHVALHPVTGRTASEWNELYAVVSAGDAGKPDILYIPDTAELARIAKTTPRTLVTLSDRLESLLRTLIRIFEHAGPA